MGASVKKIDHLMIVSSSPRKLFDLFTETFHLPVAWEFKDYGSFSSGGVFVGNTNLEFLGTSNFLAKGTDTAFVGGVALAPNSSLKAAIHELDALGIEHGPEKPFTVPAGPSREMLLWTNLPISSLLPGDPGVFFCAYAFDVRKQYEKNELRLEANAGPFGLKSLREIIIETHEYERDIVTWQKLLWPRSNSGGLFEMEDGPNLRIRPGQQRGVKNLVFEVGSLASARKFVANGYLRADLKSSLSLAPWKFQMLEFELVGSE